MHAGPPDTNHSDDLVDRLGLLVATADDAGRAQADRGKALVLALTDQLAAGQAETLYGLHTAAKSVADRGRALERLAEQLPTEIADRVRQLVDELTDDAGAQIRDALDAASTRLGIVVEGVHRELTQQQESYLTVLRESAETTGVQLSEELEHAATVVVESAGRAKASQTAVRAAAVAAVEALESSANAVTEQFLNAQEELAQAVEQSIGAMTNAAEAFTQDSDGLIQAMTVVGESFVSQLFQVLDERAERDRLAEERMTTRVEGLARAMQAQIERLEERDLAERSTTVADLHAVLERILAQPRGKLRELRSTTKPGPAESRPVVPQPVTSLREEPVYQAYEQDLYDDADADDDADVAPPPEPAVRAPAKKAAAKKAPGSKAAVKKAPGSKAAMKKAPAEKAARTAAKKTTRS